VSFLETERRGISSGLVAVSDVGGILLVDDDRRNRLAIEAALGSVAHVVQAQSGEEALRHLLNQDFALILLDVQMPRMDGFKTASLIRQRERSQRTPIVFITAFDHDDREILHAYELGAVDFLFKPIVPELLRAKAAVFVELARERAAVAHQAELLRQHERREHQRAFAEERRSWEEQLLRLQVEQQRRAAEQQAQRAEELARLITVQQKTELELTRVNRELAAVDQRKDEFLAVLAHELRNPLAPLLHGLELMRVYIERKTGDPTNDLLRTRTLMERQILHLRRLVEDLLDFSRINLGKIELRRSPVEVSEVIRHAVATSAPRIEENAHKLEVVLPERPLFVNADEVRLIQVISNLLNNASRYTEPGGMIQLRCRAEDGEVVLEVSDNGRGVEPELLPRVFELFVQGGPSGDGLGLGLNLVRYLVQLHGGRVYARSEGRGCGSTFTVRLPELADARAPTRPGGARSAEPADKRDANRSQRLRVVVVDDHSDIRASLQELLRLWGHEVEVASDGESGLDLILRTQPDIAFVDISMPKLDGFAVARRIREALPAEPIRLIAMTGFGQEDDRQRALASGFDLHLVKPATPDALRAIFSGS
jgi:signal transduction histidine kinase